MTATSLPFAGKRLLLVAAHPDDETLLAASQFSACRTLRIVHTTDGATSRRAARANGFSSRAAYADARRSELATSLVQGFSLHAEQFRPARDYDFSVPPFAGPLGYEIDPRAPEGRAWRALVGAEFIHANNRAFHRAQLWFAFKKARIKRKFSGLQLGERKVAVSG